MRVQIQIRTLLKSPTLLFELSIWVNDKKVHLELAQIHTSVKCHGPNANFVAPTEMSVILEIW